MLTRSLLRKTPVIAGAALAGSLFLHPVPVAAHTTAAAKGSETASTQSFQANLKELNGSGTNGSAHVEVDGDTTHVKFMVTGASPGLPHAVHIHSRGSHECPTIANDTDGNGLITTLEGLPAYGEIVVSLTTTGDVSVDSALAVGRFAPATENGTIDYSRSFELPVDVDTKDIANGVVVLHGISELSGDPFAYDGPLMSDLNPDLPEEATIPATCGPLQKVTPAPAAVADLVQSVKGGANAFDAEVQAALSELTNGKARGEFKAAYNNVVAQHHAAVNAAVKQFNADLRNGVNADVARDRLVNEFNASKAQALNALHAAKDGLNNFINGSNGNAAEREEFNNSFNTAVSTLSNELEVAKNAFVNASNRR